MTAPPLKIGVAGLGTVGAATVRLLQTHPDLMAKRCGRMLEVVAVSARDRTRDRDIDLSACRWFEDAVDLAASPDVDVVVELIGGSEGVAREVCETALKAGKHLVTANKALLAHHGAALARLAERDGQNLGYEAAVAGGIPIIKGLREGLAGNEIHEVHGILNGTCNYILTKMQETGAAFETVLAEAQALGYAEADPAFDVDGIDAAHKIALLAAVAFGCRVRFAPENVEGIRKVSADDIRFAGELGYRIKLLGIARLQNGILEQRVHPCLIPLDAPLANVHDAFNAVVAEGSFVDRVVMIGRGAGAGPTASAVVADLADIACARHTPVLGLPVAHLADLAPAPLAARRGAYYLRLRVRDEVGVLASIATALRDESVSIEQFLQHRRNPGELVPVVLTTHVTEEAAMMRGLETIRALDSVHEDCLIRIEAF